MCLLKASWVNTILHTAKQGKLEKKWRGQVLLFSFLLPAKEGGFSRLLRCRKVCFALASSQTFSSSRQAKQVLEKWGSQSYFWAEMVATSNWPGRQGGLVQIAFLINWASFCKVLLFQGFKNKVKCFLRLLLNDWIQFESLLKAKLCFVGSSSLDNREEIKVIKLFMSLGS